MASRGTAFHAVLFGQRLEIVIVAAGGLKRCWPRSNIGASFELTGSHFVVPSLGGNTEFERSRSVSIMKPRTRSGRHRIVSSNSCPLGGFAPNKGVRRDQVRSRQEEVPIDQEVLLFRAAERYDVIEIGVTEQLQDAFRCTPMAAGYAVAAIL